MNAGYLSLRKPSWLSLFTPNLQSPEAILTDPVVARFLLLLGVLSAAMPMGSHHLRVLQVQMMMFMVCFVAMRHAFMAVGMVMEKLKLLVLAGMLPT